MTSQRRTQLRSLEGRSVNVALPDGSRIDGGHLIAVGRHQADVVWLFVDGTDAFLQADDIVEVWEARPACTKR